MTSTHEHIVWLHQHIFWLNQQNAMLQQRMNVFDLNIRDLYASEHSTWSLYRSNFCEVDTHRRVVHCDASTQTTSVLEGARWRLFAATVLLRGDIDEIRNLQQCLYRHLPKQFDMERHDIGVPNEDDDFPTELIQLAGKCDMKEIIDANEGFQKLDAAAFFFFFFSPAAGEI